MKIDLTYELNEDNIARHLRKLDTRDQALLAAGHFGTHFDVMDKTFPLDYTECRGVVFDVSAAVSREITVDDVCLEQVRPGDFVLLHTGVIQRHPYGSDEYTAHQGELSWPLIEALVAAGIRLIGVDMRGLRRGADHPRADRYCADHDVFVIENLVNLHLLTASNRPFVVHTYPLNLRGFSGIPTRVIAETAEE